MSGSDKVLPATEMVGIADGGDSAFIGNAGLVEAQEMHADAVKLADDLPILPFGVGNDAGGDGEKGAASGILRHGIPKRKFLG